MRGSGVLINFALIVPPYEAVAALLVRRGYLPVPLEFGRKKPSPKFGWQHYRYAPEHEQEYRGCGTGLLTGSLAAADIDVRDPKLARDLASLAQEILGVAPTRVGLPPKLASIYRVEGKPFRKLQTLAYRLPGDDPESKPHKVEFLADGQQIVAFNIHPETGRPYKWIGGRSPLTVPFRKLPSVTLGQAEGFIRRAEVVLSEHGTRVGRFAQAEIDSEHTPNEALRASDPDELRDALRHIPNDDECYDDWIRMIYAVKGALGRDGREDALQWSAKSSKDHPKTTKKGWESARPTRIGAGTIYFHARQHGWRPQQVTGGGRKWPENLSPAAYQGLIGEIVHAIEPETESDPAALILQTLIAFGALVGRGPHVLVESDQHHTNLFAVLVGGTSKGRKGTAWGRVKEIFSSVPDWPGTATGLSSGEGLKYHVRDPVIKTFVNQKTGETKDITVDKGVEDKRLLVFEPEYAQVLRQASRAGNVLSAAVRSAWESGDLQTLTKHDPIEATGAHICMIGHVTTDELRVEMTATEQANGFANRFLFMCVKRSQLLPRGGKPIDKQLARALVDKIWDAVMRARQLGGVARTPAAFDLWDREYGRLSEGSTGLFGAVTARAEAQVLRLALTYALADGAEQIDKPHLEAALAVWDRAEASARFIFGAALGNSVADEILRSLRAAGTKGMTRTDIRDLFGRHENKERVGAALELLAAKKLAIQLHKPSEGGRPAEVWMVAEAATKATKATKVRPATGVLSHKSHRSRRRRVVRVRRRGK